MESGRRLWPTLVREKRILRGLVCLLAAALGAAALACGGAEESTGSPAFVAGQELFNNNCALCHGDKATGTDSGPPLVHRLYVPNHHSDLAFQSAVKNGVATHHWRFGDMPPVPGLSEGEVDNIICYVRNLQRNSGLLVEVSC